MSKRRPYGLIVVGAEVAGLAAAGCAAREGARVALLDTGDKPPQGASEPAVPDFVWRKLNLQDFGLDAKPIEARISLFPQGRALRTFQSMRKTQEELELCAPEDARLWAAFARELSRLREDGEAIARRSALGARGKNAPPAFLGALTGQSGATLAARLTQRSRALLDDYFRDEALKIHLASIALSPFGLGGDEAGSALALGASDAPAAWRVRAGRKGPSVERALEEAALAAGAEIIEARIEELSFEEEKSACITLHNGEALRGRRVMAASLDAAARAHIAVAPAFSPLARRDGARAHVRLRLQKAATPSAGARSAIYYLADSLSSFAEARDAVLEGRLYEKAPISFEYQKDEIIVDAPYCPAFLNSDGESREWTEQDRQALGRQIVERLSPFIEGGARAVKRIEVRIAPSVAPQGDRLGIAAPPPGHDPVGAAARLALDLINGE